MLKLTKKSEYGLIALRHLAVHGRHGAASAKEIADRYQIPLPLLAKVLQKLAKGGLLVSSPGSSGGYSLARGPEKISALEVIRTIDGPVRLASCFTPQGKCGQQTACSVREPLRRLHLAIVDLLGATTISEMYEDSHLL